MDIAAIEVVGTQTFKVTGELLTGILVVILEERQPVGGFQLEQATEVFLREHAIANDVDVLNRRHRPFVDIDLQCHAVTRLRYDFGVDGGRIAALGNILPLQLVTHTFQSRALENLAFGQTGLVQTLEQVLGLDRLVAFDFDTGDRRTLDHTDDQYVTITPQLDILKETGFEQCPRGIDQGAIVDFFAHI